MPSLKRLLLCLAFAARCAAAQTAQDAPPVNAASIMAGLRAIEQKQAQQTRAQADRVLRDFSAASSSNGSAVAFYLDAVEQTQFQGQNREHTQFQEWKKKEAEKLKSPDFATAARLHLAYLVLTLQRADGATTGQLLPALLGYTGDLAAAYDTTYDQELMKTSVSSGIFAHWYGIETLLSKAKDWEFTPGNLDGIFQKTILPEFRQKRDPRAVAYWDSKLAREAAKASQSKLTITGQNFDNVRRPELLWSRAQEMLRIGQRNRAITEMFALVQGYPAHPNAGEWINSLKDLLSSKPGMSTEPPAGS